MNKTKGLAQYQGVLSFLGHLLFMIRILSVSRNLKPQY